MQTTDRAHGAHNMYQRRMYNNIIENVDIYSFVCCSLNRIYE